MGRTVNPLALLSVVRIRSSPPFNFQDLMIDKICFTIIIRILRVQLSGRAPAFQAGCEGSIPFTRSMRPQLSWIEQRTSNPCVPGSNPGRRAKKKRHSQKILAKSSKLCYNIQVRDCWDIAKSVRHLTLTLVCVGSSPAIPANMIHQLSRQST